MSDLNRCTVCKGQKKILGLGCMARDCDECKGIGWIKAQEEVVTEAVNPAIKIIIDEPLTKTEKKSKNKTGK